MGVGGAPIFKRHNAFQWIRSAADARCVQPLRYQIIGQLFSLAFQKICGLQELTYFDRKDLLKLPYILFAKTISILVRRTYQHSIS